MPTVMTGRDIEEVLAIPKVSGSDTGVLRRSMVIELLRQWEEVPEWLAGLCFDTASHNTGVHSGAITIIPKAFERLLFLACQHHIVEIIGPATNSRFWQI
jgi:hypothetical protein